MNSTRTVTRLVAALLGLVLMAATLSLGYTQSPGEPFMVMDINPGVDSSEPWDTWDCNPAGANGLFFFMASDGTHGDEMWRSDATESGTFLVKDIIEGPGSPFNDYADCAAAGNLFFFYADDGTYGREVWRSDGTPEGTFMVKDINPGSPSSDPSWPSVVNDMLFFGADDGANGYQTWQSDGTEEGTVMFKDTLPGGGYVSAGTPTDVNGILFFWADDGGGNGSELWKSDGTAGGTFMVKDIKSGSDSSYAEERAAANGTYFFYYNDGDKGSELWKSDGTADGTVMVKDINPGSDSSYPTNMRWPTDVNGMLFFWANDGEHGSELWKSDGTEGGTVMVKDIRSGEESSDRGYRYDPLTAVNGALFFTPDDGTHGIELWRSDGTADGTILVKDINLGSNSSRPRATWRGLTPMDGTLFFRADDGVNGSELWKSDGTEEGTALVKDIFPGPDGSGPYYITEVDDILFFYANDAGTYGRELWAARTVVLDEVIYLPIIMKNK